MKIFIGADHAGFELKGKLVSFLEDAGHQVVDKGAYELNPTDDYPDFIIPVAKAVSEDPKSRGIVIGGSGQGEAMAANKIPGIRAAVYYGSPGKTPGVEEERSDGSTPGVEEGERIIKLSREHNDANILSLGARFITEQEAKDAVAVWLETEFSGDERHIRRIKKMDDAVGHVCLSASKPQGEFDKWNEIKKETNESSRRFFREGDIFYMRCGKNIGFEEDGKGASFERPVLVLKRFNKNIFIGVPLSTTQKTGRYYFKIGKIDGKENTAIVSQIRLFDAMRIVNKIGFVKDEFLEDIRKHIKEHAL